MKNFASAFLMLTLLFMLPMPAQAAGSSVTQAVANIATEGLVVEYRTITFSWTADDTDGSVPATAMSAANIPYTKGWYIYALLTDPGATAPTDDYDITITDSHSIDLLGGSGADRDTANSEIAFLTNPVPIIDTITFNLSGNSVNSAVGDAILILVKKP